MQEQASCSLLVARRLIPLVNGRRLTAPQSFSLSGGQIGLLTGGNGSGKTSIFRCFLGQSDYQAEELMVLGRSPISEKDYWALARSGLGLILQEPALPMSFSIFEYELFWRRTPVGHRLTLGDWALLSRALKLDEHDLKGRQIGKLSAGQRRIVQLCFMIFAKPRLIVADEPFAGLAPKIANLIESELRSLVFQGSAMLASAHQPELDFWQDFTWRLCIDED